MKSTPCNFHVWNLSVSNAHISPQLHLSKLVLDPPKISFRIVAVVFVSLLWPLPPSSAKNRFFRAVSSQRQSRQPSFWFWTSRAPSKSADPACKRRIRTTLWSPAFRYSLINHHSFIIWHVVIRAFIRHSTFIHHSALQLSIFTFDLRPSPFAIHSSGTIMFSLSFKQLSCLVTNISLCIHRSALR